MDAVIFRNGAGDDLCPGLPPGRMRAGQGGHPKKRKGPDPLGLGLFSWRNRLGRAEAVSCWSGQRLGLFSGNPVRPKLQGFYTRGKPPSKEGAKYVKQLGCLRLQAVARILRKSKPPLF